MKVLQTVIVKQILTEKSKHDLVEQFSQQKLQLQKECEQLRFEQKKMRADQKHQFSQLQSYEHEVKARLDKINNIDFMIEQLHMLPVGSEIKQQEVQAVIDVEIGDQWNELDKTIVVKEGKVVDIR
ncbi:YlqD family protein [Bacillus pinisoli]|uniref:YlqD family protein n=1 Tax=Bacillus pinisoli TaxID=2901866 RepID=UPI001FF2D856|nr:YlqD family protein [Bacillus pinisoli]